MEEEDSSSCGKDDDEAEKNGVLVKRGSSDDDSSSSSNKINNSSSELQLFWHQVTGHNILLKYDKHTLCKPLKDREVYFYRTVPACLEPFVPHYYGAVNVSWSEDENNVAHLIAANPVPPNFYKPPPQSVTSQNSKTGSDLRIKIVHFGNKNNKNDDSGKVEIEAPSSKGNAAKVAIEARSSTVHPWSIEHCASELNKLRLSIERDGVKQFILLENLTHRFSQPCVLDLKMGTRLYGDDEPEAKKERKIRRSLESTSQEFGVRLGGMEVYDVALGSYRLRDKFYGRQLTPAQFRASIYEFLHNGKRLRFELIEPFKRRLNAIIEALQHLAGFRFFSSSLLLIYDGFPPSSEGAEVNNGNGGNGDDDSLVDVRMVDFAYTTWPDCEGDADLRYSGPDAGYLLGLITISTYLDDLLNGKNTTDSSS